MKLWTRNGQNEHLSTALVGPATVPGLAVALDPIAPYVLMLDFTPIQGAWQDAAIPLTPGSALQPTRVAVRRVTADVLLDTTAFLDLAPELAGFGCRVMQFRERPRPDVNYDDPRPHARAAKYRAAALTISIDLPHANESALLAATDSEEIDNALARLGIA